MDSWNRFPSIYEGLFSTAFNFHDCPVSYAKWDTQLVNDIFWVEDAKKIILAIPVHGVWRI